VSCGRSPATTNAPRGTKDPDPGNAFPGGEIYLSFPGLGDRLAARVAGEIGEHHGQFDTPNAEGSARPSPARRIQTSGPVARGGRAGRGRRRPAARTGRRSRPRSRTGRARWRSRPTRPGASCATIDASGWGLLRWSNPGGGGRVCLRKLAGASTSSRPTIPRAVGVRRVPVPARGDHGRGLLVPALRAVLPRRRGAAGRAGRRRRPRHGVPVGTAVHPGVRRTYASGHMLWGRRNATEPRPSTAMAPPDPVMIIPWVAS
jgi:hypothetical protein